jgi:hypothetical protein
MNKLYISMMFALTFLVSGCRAILPDLAPEPWEYPDLSDTECPDLSGTYNAAGVESALSMSTGAFLEKVIIRQTKTNIAIEGKAIKDSGSLVCTSCEGGIKKVKKGEIVTGVVPIYRPLTGSQDSTSRESFGRVCGCSHYKYVCHSVRWNTIESGDRFSPANTMFQTESILGKDHNGNLEYTYIRKDKGGGAFWITTHYPETRTTRLIERISSDVVTDGN